MVSDNPVNPDELVYAGVEELESKLDRQLQTDDDYELARSSLLAAQDFVDDFTNHAWRQRKRTEYKEWEFERRGFTGVPVFLDRMNVRSVDELKVWFAGSQTDYVAEKTEGRNADWFLVAGEGKIYIRDVRFRRPEAFEVVYTYGEGEVEGGVTKSDSVPHFVNMAVKLWAAADMIEQEGDSFMLPEGGDGVALEARPDKYRERARELLKPHRKWVPVTR